MIVVEVLDHRGHLRERVRVVAFPASIGRAYDNDIIVDDRLVSPHHARLTIADDGWVIAEDLDSLNGIRGQSGGPRISRLVVPSGGQLRLGRGSLRIVDAALPVAPAVAEDLAQGALPRLFGSALGSLVICAAAIAALTWSSYLGGYERTNTAKVVSQALALALVLAIWAGGWSLAGRLLSHRVSFLAHAAVASAALLMGVALNVAGEWLGFATGAERVERAFFGMVMLGVAIAALNAHLRLATSLARPRRLVAAASLVMAVLAFVAIDAYGDREPFSTEMEFSAILKPLDTRLVRSVSADEFSREMIGMQSRVDSLALKSRSK
jgi:hypothetical protein